MNILSNMFLSRINQGFSQVQCFGYKFRKFYEYFFPISTHQFIKFVHTRVSNIRGTYIFPSNIIICWTFYDEMIFVFNVRVTQNTQSLISVYSSPSIPTNFYT